MNLSKHKRIKDKKVIAACRKNYCEVCGRQANIEPHHIFTVGSGGCDIKENLIQLCTDCHIRAHTEGVNKMALLMVIAHREDTTADALYIANRRSMGWNV